MADVKITVKRNGPFRVECPEGAISLVDADGNPYDLTGKTAFSLCRCGGSTNKPFCDGTHSKIGFQAAEAAVKKAVEDEQLRQRRRSDFRKLTPSRPACMYLRGAPQARKKIAPGVSPGSASQDDGVPFSGRHTAQCTVFVFRDM